MSERINDGQLQSLVEWAEGPGTWEVVRAALTELQERRAEVARLRKAATGLGAFGTIYWEDIKEGDDARKEWEDVLAALTASDPPR